MLMRRFFLILLGLAVLSVPQISAKSMVDSQIDSLLQSNKIIHIDGRPESKDIFRAYNDSIRGVISAYYYDQFRHFSDPAAPYFLFMSKDAALTMGIGGCVRMRAYYDWGGASPTSAFSPFLLPINPSPTDMRHFGTTPSGTCLYFRVIGRNKALGDYQLYIEADFTGYQGLDFRLKKAYAMINDFTVGYAPSTFSDPAAQPPMIDANGASNKITPTAVLIRYMRPIKGGWSFAMSAETPSNAVDADGSMTAKVSNWLPDAAVFGQYQWAPGQHVRLAGIVRSLSYRNLAEEKNHNTAGWGMALSSVAHVTDRITTYVTTNYGHGYASLGGDLMIGSYDLVARPDAPGKMYSPASYGYCLGLQYNFRPNLFSTVSFSQTRLNPSHQIDPNDYKYGWIGTVNVFWNMTARMQVGAEFNIGKRANFSGEHRYGRRVEAMCMFSF